MLLILPNFNDGWDNKQIKLYYEENHESYHKPVKHIVKDFSQN